MRSWPKKIFFFLVLVLITTITIKTITVKMDVTLVLNLGNDVIYNMGSVIPFFEKRSRRSDIYIRDLYLANELPLLDIEP